MTTTAASLDPRTTLARPDLAEQALEGVVRAAAFRAARPMHCAVAVADIHAEALAGPDPIDQLIFGEAFDVLDSAGDRVWGRARRDGVVGWIRADALAEGAPLATHRVGAVDARLPLNALVVEPGEPGGLSPIGDFSTTPVDVAERLVGVPHRLGARSSVATDCSGLVQQALYACGLAGPRYADQQAQLGRAIAPSESRRGDLVIWLDAAEAPWNGHAAFLLEGERVLHAVGGLGGVVIEPLVDADARHRGLGGAAPIFRRL